MPVSKEQAIRNTIAINNLRICMGHVANASDTPVTFSQDDATGAFIVKVGNQLYWGDDLFIALQNAADDQK